MGPPAGVAAKPGAMAMTVKTSSAKRHPKAQRQTNCSDVRPRIPSSAATSRQVGLARPRASELRQACRAVRSWAKVE